MDEFLRPYSDATKEAARLILSDERTRRHVSQMHWSDLENVIHVFELATNRRAWDSLTGREQREWMDAFDKTFSRLVELLQTAPTPPESWGFPVRMDALLYAAEAMGVPVPPEGDVDGRLSATLRLEEAVDATGWTIIDALQHFKAQQGWDIAIPQQLPKPRDAKAPRAAFLRQLQSVSPGLTSAVVAALASVMFGEEVDERTVRAFKPERFLDKSKNPS
ncbi:hypothetical protein [Pseudoxanthomonas taiwanensis]|uniref:Uncharacterized protein n=1 Tax=Pseudoxanthomonas taiwanensis TaxID=176598 RepID=A0A921NUG7_9GAMM|nr:hypothetical protein [Pseudoxanthomonas taiwanensis]KAF1690189.1 hypothetical protein CR938_03155 [Pseudoxanthomonas taiwanensis]